jgi:hypothetical protein
VESAVELPLARARFDVGGLLPVAVPLALIAVAVAAIVPALVTQDAWLTLVGGRDIAHHGLPHVARLTELAGGHRFVDQQWLAQLLLYGSGSLAGMVAICLAAALTAFGLCAAIAHRRGASPTAILLFSVLAFAAAPWGLQVRAQSLALPLFALTLLLLELDRPWLTLPVLGVWANVHGSVVVGAAVVVAYAVCRRRRALLAAPLMVLASPYVLELPRYYRTMLLDPPFGSAVAEWQRTTPSPLTAVFFALLTATALLVVRRRRLAAFDLVVLALGAAVALDAIRGIVWFALGALALVPAVATRDPGRIRLRGSRQTVASLLVAVAAVGFAAARPAQAYESRVPEPVLAAAAGHGPIFANEASADWLLWRDPSLRVAYDVQFETLTKPQIDRLLAWRNFGPGWRHVVTGYSVVVDDPKHVARLVAAGGWREIFAAPRIAVARRISS